MSKGGHYLAQKPQKPRKQTKTWVIVVAVILAVVLVVGALAAWFVVSKMNKINRAERGDNQLSAEDIGKYMVEETTDAAVVLVELLVERSGAGADTGQTRHAGRVLLHG